MLTIKPRKKIRWGITAGYFLLAAAMFAGVGFIGFKLFGLVGSVGVLLVLSAIITTGWLATAEDERPGGFNNPKTPETEKEK